MTILYDTISSGLSGHYELLASRVHELATPLSDEQFWQKPFSFGNSFGPSKGEVMKRFDEAVAMVARTVRAQSEKDWALPYTAMREVDAGNRFNIFLRCASHLHHHLGQMTYLQFALLQK